MIAFSIAKKCIFVTINCNKMNFLNISLGFVGPQSMILIAVVILLLFGGRKIPELMKGLGGGIKEFKKATKEEEEEPKKVDKEN